MKKGEGCNWIKMREKKIILSYALKINIKPEKNHDKQRKTFELV